MERKITIKESVPIQEDYQNKMLEENQVEDCWKCMDGNDDKAVMIMM
ncbi:MAG: hypothetical protein ACLU80_00455 [Dorea sp.]